VRPATPSDDRGLTLVEILIALVVISVGLVGIAIVVPVSSEAIQHGGQLSRATFLAEQTLEQARMATWTSTPAVDCLGVSSGEAPPAPTGPGCHGSTVSRFPDEVSVGGDPAYRRILRVADCSAVPCAGVTDAALRLVTVVVTYRTPGTAGQPTTDKAVTLEWLVTQR
jgi:prepilin-type N-terminal cleavage/methylation domain-containing protein